MAAAFRRAIGSDGVEILVGAADHRVDARRQAALLGITPIQAIGRLVDAGVVHAGQADAGHRFERGVERIDPFVLVRRRNGFFDQGHRSIDEYAGGFAVRIAFDAATNGVLGIARDAGTRQRQAVRPARMAIHAFEPGGAIGDGGIEFLRSREAAQFPDDLIPAAAAYPTGAAGFGVRLCDGQRLVQRLRRRQVGLARHLAEPHHMTVRIDQARQHDATAAIDALCIGMRLRARRIAGGDDLAVFYEQGIETLQLAGGVERVALHRRDQQLVFVRLRGGER